MNVFQWIEAGLLGVMLVLLVVWAMRWFSGRDRSRTWKVLGLLIASFALTEIASLLPDPLRVVALGLAILATIFCGVFTVRDVRASWRAEMEKVKHL